MKIQTVNQLISVFKDVATRHYQINGFGIGDDWESGATENMHPVLWVNPVTASMPSSDNGYKTFEIDFDIRIFDLVSKDESNENDVLSDCIDILKDIISEFKRHPYYVNSQLNIIDDISFEAFTEELDEEVSGWSCEITLMTPILNTFCGIPSADITGFEFPGHDCPEVNVLCPVFVEDVTGVNPIVVTTVGTTKEISIVGGGLSDTFVVSGTYNDATDNLELLRNDGVTVLADLSSVGGSVDTNTFVLSGSFDSATKQLTLTKNDASNIVISGFTDENDNDNDYTTSATLTGNIITFDRTDTTSAYSVDLTSILSSGGGDNISNADLTFDGSYNADLNGNAWQLKDSTGANRLLLDVQKGAGDGHGIGYGGAAVDGQHTFYNTIGNQSEALCNMSAFNGLKLSSGALQNDYLNFGSLGFYLGIKTNVSYGANIKVYPDLVLRTQHSGYGVTFDTNNYVNFKKAGTQHSIIDFLSRWILRGSAVIGAEKISLQDDTLVKGSDTSASTSGFKVLDSTNASLLEVKNNGVINASKLPTSATGLVSGDIWNNSGVLNIV